MLKHPLPGVCVSIQLNKAFLSSSSGDSKGQRSPALSLIIQQWFQPVFPEGPNIIVGVLVNMTSCLSTPFLPRRSRDLGGKSTRYGAGNPCAGIRLCSSTSSVIQSTIWIYQASLPCTVPLAGKTAMNRWNYYLLWSCRSNGARERP